MVYMNTNKIHMPWSTVLLIFHVFVFTEIIAQNRTVHFGPSLCYMQAQFDAADTAVRLL